MCRKLAMPSSIVATDLFACLFSLLRRFPQLFFKNRGFRSQVQFVLELAITFKLGVWLDENEKNAVIPFLLHLLGTVVDFMYN